jgi:BRCA1-associated RING domain protein 1
VYNADDPQSLVTHPVIRISRQEVDAIIRSDPKNPLALFVAATRGDAELTQQLLKRGADPNHKTDFGYFPLHEAASHGHVQIVELLLAAGAKPNVRSGPKGPDTPNQWTPLHYAASGGYVEIAEELIAKGADVNARDYWGRTPLHYVQQRNHYDLVLILKAKGAKD